MNNLPDKDFINAEIIAVEVEIDNKDSEIEKTRTELELVSSRVSELRNRVEKLYGERTILQDNFKIAKDDLGKLKRSVWISDDPNVIELRNQLLLAAKLVKDDS